MTTWFRRTLIRSLIGGPIAYFAISILMLFAYVWFFSNALNISSGENKVYKNYVEKFFIYEILPDAGSFNKKIAKDILLTDEIKEGTFVVVPISGAILSDSAQRIWDQLYIAARITPNLKAIIFLIDSPGGGATASDHLYEEVRKIKTRGIKIVSFVDSLSASGAYYITAQSDRIVSSPTGTTGSIGVIWRLINAEQLGQKIGVSEEVIKSSEMKDIGSPFKKMSGSERMVLQRVVDHSYDRFRSIVQKGRGLSDSQIDLASTGAVWHPEDAKTLGLVDEIGYMDRAVEVAMELTGVNMPVVIQYQEEITVWDILGTRSPLIGLIGNLSNAVKNPDIFSSELLYMWIP
ncbi:MAG: signal peptide peptidase SppA [Candidatus Yanofskybacteria bacterium]|nr:signal peptide peptidase SppA [Candidatus Yanofskybacteria bacterium]